MFVGLIPFGAGAVSEFTEGVRNINNSFVPIINYYFRTMPKMK